MSNIRDLASMNTNFLERLPPPLVTAPKGWRILLAGETVQYGDMSLEINPLRWAPVGRGGYLVKIGIYIRRVEAVPA